MVGGDWRGGHYNLELAMEYGLQRIYLDERNMLYLVAEGSGV